MTLGKVGILAHLLFPGTSGCSDRDKETFKNSAMSKNFENFHIGSPRISVKK